MIEELKQILEIVKDLPHLVMWVLAGLLVYKIAIIGSMFGIVKLFIERMHSLLTKEKTYKYKVSDHIISDVTEADIDDVFRAMKMSTGVYIHKSDIERLKTIINEYKESARKQ